MRQTTCHQVLAIAQLDINVQIHAVLSRCYTLHDNRSWPFTITDVPQTCVLHHIIPARNTPPNFTASLFSYCHVSTLKPLSLAARRVEGSHHIWLVVSNTQIPARTERILILLLHCLFHTPWSKRATCPVIDRMASAVVPNSDKASMVRERSKQVMAKAGHACAAWD